MLARLWRKSKVEAEVLPQPLLAPLSATVSVTVGAVRCTRPSSANDVVRRDAKRRLASKRQAGTTQGDLILARFAPE